MMNRMLNPIVSLLVVAAVHVNAAQQAPNIVVILADDYGYGSANCYGADLKHVRTPHINRLAEEGLRFTDASTPASVCSPTRYAMLTGRYAWRGVMKHSVLSPPEGPLAVEDELFTLPEFLKEQGYQTAHVGKWHLGYTDLPIVHDLSAQPLEPGPRSLGFDYHFAVPNNLDWLDRIYVENESIWGLRSKGKTPYGASFYKGQQYHGYDAPQAIAKDVTQDLSDKASEWIAKTVTEEPGKPFFLYFAPVAVHHPIAPSDSRIGTSGVGAYGDFIQDLDHSVGEIIDALTYNGVLDNTLIIFTSDNGGDLCPESKVALEAGMKFNGDLRGDKHLIWQGGFNVPFIVRWPAVVAPGTESDRMINVVDIYATVQELLTGKVLAPTKAAADSFSFYSTLQGKITKKNVRESMVLNDVAGVRAIRSGDWKYINGIVLRPPAKNRPPELYNLKDDPSEEKNVINEFPEISARMLETLEAIESTGSERIVGGKGS